MRGRRQLRGFGLRTKLVALALAAAALPVLAFVALTASGRRSSSRDVAAELESVARMNLGQYVRDLYTTCGTIDGLLAPRLTEGLSHFQRLVREAGGISWSGPLIRWELASLPGQSLAAPLVSVGKRPLAAQRSFNLPQPVVDELNTSTGVLSTIYQRLDDRGDMLAIASSIQAEGGLRMTGSLLPAATPDGSPEPAVVAALAGATHRAMVRIGGRLFLTSTEPLRDPSGRVAGMAMVAVGGRELEALYRTIVETKVGEKGYLAILGAKGRQRGVYFISRGGARDGEDIWNIRDAAGKAFVRDTVLAAVNREPGAIGTTRYQWQNPDDPGSWTRVVADTYFGPWDWYLNAGTDERDFLGAGSRMNAAFDRLLRHAAFGGVLALALAAAVGLFLAHRLARPLVLLLGDAERLGRGDLRGALAPAPLPGRSRDETRLLSHAFASMAAAFSSLVRQVQRSGIQVVTSATQIAASARQLEDSVAHQATATPQVSASARQISSTARQLAGTIDAVASVASQTAVRAVEGRAALSQMDGSVRRISASSSSVSLRLAAISDRARSISTLVTTITRVADQTNLLSLNAAIEAEKAGEQGRGFAVVALEIRRLADQTAVTTLDIEHTVQGVFAAVSSGVLEMDKFVDEVRLAIAEVDRIGLLLSGIVEDVQGLGPRLDSVRSAARAQADGAAQISEAMSLLDHSAASSSDTLAEFRAATLSLQDAVASLRGEVSRLEVDP